MTRPSNVRMEDTGVTHARAWNDRRVTRCGLEYDYLYAPLFNETEDAVDCMTCLTKDEATHGDPRVIRTVHGIKDLR